MTGLRCATETSTEKNCEASCPEPSPWLRQKQSLCSNSVIRFSLILLITALPLIGMEAMSTRKHQTPKRVFDVSKEALQACQHWRHQEGQFSALIPAALPVSTQARTVQTDMRSCEADLDQALILGRRYSVVATAHYNKTLHTLHRPIHRTFPYLEEERQTDD